MGAAKRKRDLAGGLKRLQAGGQGLLGIEIVTPFHVSELGAKFLAGDNHAGPLPCRAPPALVAPPPQGRTPSVGGAESNQHSSAGGA